MALLELESDDLLLALLARVPLLSHGALRATCRRANALLRSDGFRAARRASGLAEHGLMIMGGAAEGRAVAECWMVVGGRCRPIEPLSIPRAFACAAVFAAV